MQKLKYLSFFCLLAVFVFMASSCNLFTTDRNIQTPPASEEPNIEDDSFRIISYRAFEGEEFLNSLEIKYQGNKIELVIGQDITFFEIGQEAFIAYSKDYGDEWVTNEAPLSVLDSLNYIVTLQDFDQAFDKSNYNYDESQDKYILKQDKTIDIAFLGGPLTELNYETKDGSHIFTYTRPSGTKVEKFKVEIKDIHTTTVTLPVAK